MKQVTEKVKSFLEQFFNCPVKQYEAKMILETIFKEAFDSLLEKEVLVFPKGYGSLRIKKLKPFEIQDDNGVQKTIVNKRIVRYYPGHYTKRRLNDGR